MTTEQKRVLLIVLGVFIAIIVIVSIITAVTSNKTDDTVLRDRDTGEVVDMSEEANQNTGGGAELKSGVLLFGLANLSTELLNENNETGDFYDGVKDAVWTYSKNRLDDKFESITIRPQGLKLDGSTITGTIRLGQTDTTLPFSITLSSNKRSAITTINDSGNKTGEYGGKFIYVSGLENEDMFYTISQVNDTSADLTIDTQRGYRDIALQYIYDLGYNPSDLTITFTNYENPFL